MWERLLTVLPEAHLLAKVDDKIFHHDDARLAHPHRVHACRVAVDQVGSAVMADGREEKAEDQLRVSRPQCPSRDAEEVDNEISRGGDCFADLLVPDFAVFG